MDEQPNARETQDEPEESEEQPSQPAGEHVDTRALVVTCISLLAAKAWEGMGLVPNAATKRIERRFDEAQLAIDAVAALVEIVRARVAETDRRDLNNLLMNLRLNFVEQKGKAGGESQPSGS